MIELIKISIFELRNLVEIAYTGDSDLLDKYWGDGYSLQEAIDANLQQIEKIKNIVEESGKKMSFYAVLWEGEEIGYVAFFPNNLYSFSININYRKQNILSEYWEAIKKVIGNSFVSQLFPQNTRAINWLKKCGMVEVPGIEDNCVILLNVE